MYRSITLSLLAVITLPSAAQNGAIGEQTLSEIRQMQPKTNAALNNAIANVSIKDLARNFKNSGDIDTHFTVETPSQNITDQKSSGRCWMFSGLNVLRADFARRHNDSLHVDLSQDYLFFWDQLEKANLFLQTVIDNSDKPIDDQLVQMLFRSPIGDGGTFCGVADLAEKYGLAPANIALETYSANATSQMTQLISSKLREQGLELRRMAQDKASAKEMEQAKTDRLATIYRMLTMTLGEPVGQFNYAFLDKDGKRVGEEKSYTPREFYRAVVGGAINGTFIMVMNDPRRPYHKTYEVELDRHLYDGHNWVYLNLPMDDMEELAIAALKDSAKLYSSYDVSKQLDRQRGYCDLNNYDYGTLFSTTFSMDKAQRISTFDSGSTHAMTLTAVDLDRNGKARKWKVENSWGAAWGQKGCLIMTDPWLREYMFRLVVPKKYVPEALLKEALQKPTIVPPFDPLFLYDE